MLDEKAGSTEIFSNTPAVDWLSAARFFLSPAVQLAPRRVAAAG